MLTKQDLCSMALLKLGEKPLTSLNSDEASAQLARTLYDTTIDALLSGHPWRFATQTLSIEQNQNNEFVVPENVLRILRCSGHIYGNKIISDSNCVRMLAVTRTGTDKFPSYFVSLAATKLALEFCIPLTGNQQTLRMLISLYESEFQTAKFIDSTTDTNCGIDNFSLINARF
jgi:hypothetical protein